MGRPKARSYFHVAFCCLHVSVSSCDQLTELSVSFVIGEVVFWGLAVNSAEKQLQCGSWAKPIQFQVSIIEFQFRWASLQNTNFKVIPRNNKAYCCLRQITSQRLTWRIRKLKKKLKGGLCFLSVVIFVVVSDISFSRLIRYQHPAWFISL